MNDSQRPNPTDDLKQTLREVGNEIAKLLDQARVLAKDTAKDAGDWSRSFVSGGENARDDVFHQIERLGDLKEKGLITDDEFQAKKTELLKKIA